VFSLIARPPAIFQRKVWTEQLRSPFLSDYQPMAIPDDQSLSN